MSLDHIIVLMLENNSFDRMLGALFEPRADPQTPGGGIKGATSACSNTDQTTGKTYTLQATQMRETLDDPGHDLQNVLRQLENNGSGFVADFVQSYPQSATADRQNIMGYFEDNFLSVIHTLAKNFTVCDRWFSSMPGPTWPNRLFLYSGTSNGFTDMNAIHYWDQRTLFDLLSSHGVPWRLYYGDISSTFILVNKPDPSNCYQFRYFLSDSQRPASEFPSFCLIEPGYFGKAPNDQHPPHDIMRGEALIAEVYNALRANDDLWQRSLLIVTYDEHGGYYDHIDPPATIAPDAKRDGSGFNFDKLGVRVPMILASPWVAPGVITETFDHTSLVRYFIKRWGLDDAFGSNALGARAGSPATNSIEPYVLNAPRDTSAVARSIPVPDVLPPQAQASLTDHQRALVDMSQGLAAQISSPAEQSALLKRASNPTPAEEAQLAIDRFEAFLLNKTKSKIASPPAA
jgi:phospholipase C